MPSSTPEERDLKATLPGVPKGERQPVGPEQAERSTNFRDTGIAARRPRAPFASREAIEQASGMTSILAQNRKRDLAPPDPTAVRCTACDHSVSAEEAAVTHWSFWSDGVEGLRSFCPECAQDWFMLEVAKPQRCRRPA